MGYGGESVKELHHGAHQHDCRSRVDDVLVVGKHPNDRCAEDGENSEVERADDATSGNGLYMLELEVNSSGELTTYHFGGHTRRVAQTGANKVGYTR